MCLYNGRSSNYRGFRREAFIAVGYPSKQVRVPRGLCRNFLYVRPEAKLTVDSEAQDFYAIAVRDLISPQLYGILARFPPYG